MKFGNNEKETTDTISILIPTKLRNFIDTKRGKIINRSKYICSILEIAKKYNLLEKAHVLFSDNPELVKKIKKELESKLEEQVK